VKILSCNVSATIIWVTILLFSGCAKYLIPGVEESQLLTLPEIEDVIGSPLPSEATNIHFATRAGRGVVVRVRFDIPESDLSSFLNSFGFTSSVREEYDQILPFNVFSDEWWQLDEAKPYTGAFQKINNKAFWVLVQDQDDDIVTVYIMVAT
jgi:hypothetical protein